MSELDKYLNCDAMGGPDGCCGCLEWKADGSIICNECGLEYEVAPKNIKFKKKLIRMIPWYWLIAAELVGMLVGVDIYMIIHKYY